MFAAGPVTADAAQMFGIAERMIGRVMTAAIDRFIIATVQVMSRMSDCERRLWQTKTIIPTLNRYFWELREIWRNLGLVGLLPPPTALDGLNPAIRVAVSGFISIGDWGPKLLDIFLSINLLGLLNNKNIEWYGMNKINWIYLQAIALSLVTLNDFTTIPNRFDNQFSFSWSELLTFKVFVCVCLVDLVEFCRKKR